MAVNLKGGFTSNVQAKLSWLITVSNKHEHTWKHSHTQPELKMAIVCHVI